MPKKQSSLTPEEQRKRFEAEVQRLKEAGELAPDEAEAALDAMVRKSIKDHGA
jgi:hypothetical protein